MRMRKGGTWCLNNNLIRDKKCRQMIREVIISEISDRETHGDKLIWWEELKKRIKIKSISVKKAILPYVFLYFVVSSLLFVNSAIRQL